MWITRNKRDTYESDSLVLWLDDEKPTRKDNGDGNYQYWFGICGVDLQPYTKVWYDKYKYLKWEDEPVEVVIHERFPVHETTCLYCGTRFKYTSKNIETFTSENPWNAGEFEHEDWVQCPDCGKYVTLSHY